jgi:hypothetical protein
MNPAATTELVDRLRDVNEPNALIVRRRAADEIERLRDGRDKAVALLMADPDRSAVAAVEGLRKLLPELLADDVEQAGAILDWIGVAHHGLSLAERVRILALELATKQGYSLDEAERLCPATTTPRRTKR